MAQRALSFFQRHLFYILCYEALKFKAAQFLPRVIQIVPRKEFLRLEKNREEIFSPLSHKRLWNLTYTLLLLSFLETFSDKRIYLRLDNLICLNTWIIRDSPFGLVVTCTVHRQALGNAVSGLSVTRCWPNMGLCCCLNYTGSKTVLSETAVILSHSLLLGKDWLESFSTQDISWKKGKRIRSFSFSVSSYNKLRLFLKKGRVDVKYWTCESVSQQCFNIWGFLQQFS